MDAPRRVCGLEQNSGVDTSLELRRIRTLGRREMHYLGFTLARDWFRHKVPRLSASLAFYTLLSLAPLIIVVLSIASWVFGRQAAAGQLLWQIQELVGTEGARAIQVLIAAAQQSSSRGAAALIGVITLFFGASAVVAELRDALNTIWDVPVPEGRFGWHSILRVLRERTLSFAVVLAFGFLLLVSLAINAFVAALGSRVSWFLPSQGWALETANQVLSFVVISVLFAMLFKYLPDIEIAWTDVLLGAVTTSVLFTVGKTLIGVYLGKATFGSSYGAAGSLVIMLVWVYYSAQIFFLGAEITQAYAACFGSQPRERQQRVDEMLESTVPTPSPIIRLDEEIRPTPDVQIIG